MLLSKHFLSNYYVIKTTCICRSMNETYVDIVVIVSIHCLDYCFCIQNQQMNALRANLCVCYYASEKECIFYKRGVALFSALIITKFCWIKVLNYHKSVCSLWCDSIKWRQTRSELCFSNSLCTNPHGFVFCLPAGARSLCF